MPVQSIKNFEVLFSGGKSRDVGGSTGRVSPTRSTVMSSGHFRSRSLSPNRPARGLSPVKEVKGQSPNPAQKQAEAALYDESQESSPSQIFTSSVEKKTTYPSPQPSPTTEVTSAVKTVERDNSPTSASANASLMTDAFKLRMTHIAPPITGQTPSHSKTSTTARELSRSQSLRLVRSKSRQETKPATVNVRYPGSSYTEKSEKAKGASKQNKEGKLHEGKSSSHSKGENDKSNFDPNTDNAEDEQGAQSSDPKIERLLFSVDEKYIKPVFSRGMKEVKLGGYLTEVPSAVKAESAADSQNQETDNSESEEQEPTKKRLYGSPTRMKQMWQTPKATTIINYGDQIMAPPSGQNVRTSSHATSARAATVDNAGKQLSPTVKARQRIVSKLQSSTPKLPHVAVKRDNQDRGN